jgi:putative ABC transport system permease protein
LIGNSMRLQLAFRNVLKNRRRTALNLLMIAGSCAAITNFQGIGENTLRLMEDIVINTQYGHLQVANDKYWKPSAGDKPADKLLGVGPELAEKISKVPGVEYASGRITFFGLVSSGNSSLSARGIAFDPDREVRLRERLTIVSGTNLPAASKFQVLLGVGLQEELNVKVGAPLTLLGYTYDGSVNAVDADFIGTFQTGENSIDSTTFLVSLSTAQRLLDTDKYQNLIIQLASTDDTDSVRDKIAATLPPGMGVRTWVELASDYRKVRSLCAAINKVTGSILLLLALLAVGNTVGMSIMERTGEIGTVRALGDNRTDVFMQFILEGVVLAVLGGLLGLVLGVVAAYVVTALKIPIEMPARSTPMPLGVDLKLSFMLSAFAMTSVITIIATAIPAVRASRLKVVDALRRNI